MSGTRSMTNELNRQLRDELQTAAKAAENAKLLNLLYMGASFADFAAKAADGLPPKDQEAIAGQATREGVFSVSLRRGPPCRVRLSAV